MSLGPLLFAAIASLPAQECVRPRERPNADVYAGVAPTGYRGGMEADERWMRDVRPVRTATGDTAYVFRRQRAKRPIRYDSIEPLELSARRRLYLAWRDGCADLTSISGWPLPLGPVAGARLADEGVTPYGTTDSARVYLVGEDSLGRGERAVLLVRGHVVAQSPHLQRSSYSTTLYGTGVPSGLLLVAARSEYGVGVMDPHTLRDVLAPVWRGASGVYWYDDRANERGAYLLADAGRELKLFRRDGTPVPLARFDTLHLQPVFFPVPKGRPPHAPVLVTRDSVTKSCRVYRWDATPIIADTMRIDEYGYCPRPRSWRSDTQPDFWLTFTDLHDRVQVYRIGASDIEHTGRDVDGVLAFAFGNGIMVVARGTGDARRFHVLRQDGSAIPDAVYEKFQHLGCGFTEVWKAGNWWSLLSDGSTDPRRRYPFSC